MPEQSIAFDGSIPAFYDRHLGPVLFEPYARDLVNRLDLARRDRSAAAEVLELACGTGRVTRILRERLPEGSRLVATDLMEPMLAHARSALASQAAIEWRQADAAALPFPKGSFDAVLCQFGIMFVPDKLAAMKEARRVLRPGGVFLFNVWDRMEENDLGRVAHETIARFFPENPPQFYSVPFGFHDPKEIRSLLEQAAFADVTLDTVALVSEAASAHHAAVGLVRGNPTANDIEERGGVAVETVVDAVAEELKKRFGDSPLRARMRAIVVQART